MMLTGTMSCRNQDEFDDVFNKLSGLPVDIAAYDLELYVEYEPDDKQTDLESKIIVARLTDIIESVETHGFSLMAERM